jgi:hypothetical protein
MLLHSFFTGTSTVFFETAASALFLARYDATLLPFVYLAAATVSILTGFGYTRAKEQVRFAPLMRGTLVLMLGMTCLTRLGLGLGEAGWLVFSMMIAYRVLSSLTDLEYWAVAARLYDVQQSKRLFGLVGSGEVVARILGSFSVPLLVPVLGVENLIWLSAAGLASALAILTVILRRFSEIESRDDDDGRAASGGTRGATGGRAMRSLLESGYLKAIFVLAFCAVLGKYFVDFAFLSEMQTRWHEVENLASFFGLFSGVTQVINLMVRVLVSGRLLARFGILVGLLVLPAAHIVATLGIVAAASIPLPIAVFWLVISNQGLYKTLNHPVYNPSFKVLYQPLPRRDRLAAQIFVEVILTPIAIAFAAALMIAFSHPVLAAPAMFAGLMLANFIAWCAAAFFAFREYGTALVRALQKRTLDRTAFSLEDEQSVNLVRARLESERADEVIFALDILQRIDHPSLATHFGELLTHPSPDVRFYVSLQIEKRATPSLASAVASVVGRDPSPRVRAVALRALAALGDPDGQVPAYLGHRDREVERGALIGLLHYPNQEHAEKARVRLLALARSPIPEDRILAARVLGESSLPDPETLRRLLEDDDVAVRRAGLQAAGKKGESALFSRLIDHLAEPRYRSDAARALVDAGEGASSLLAAALLESARPVPLRARIARIAARLDSFPRDALWNAYRSDGGPLRQEALAALAALAHDEGESGLPRVLECIEREVREAAWKLGILKDIAAVNELEALTKSLQEEIDQCRDRVFTLLSFVYDRKTLKSARDNLDSASREKRAYAAEILEVTLPQEIKELSLPLLDHAGPEERLTRLSRRFPQVSRDARGSLVEVIARSDGNLRAWTKACALYGAAKLGSNGSFPVSPSRDDPNPLIAETARWASSARLSTEHRSPRMLTIEKVLLLKGVSMFSATSEDTLADVANVLEEVELRSGELVFSKGDPGDSMYVVASGRVRVFDGHKTINYLDEREIFGELALLDPEPRSASVEACEETRLFRLDRDTLFELMTDNVGVVSGIMQVLCRRLRRMTAIATGDPR